MTTRSSTTQPYRRQCPTYRCEGADSPEYLWRSPSPSDSPIATQRYLGDAMRYPAEVTCARTGSSSASSSGSKGAAESIVPTTQTLLYHLNTLTETGHIPPLPVAVLAAAT